MWLGGGGRAKARLRRAPERVLVGGQRPGMAQRRGGDRASVVGGRRGWRGAGGKRGGGALGGVGHGLATSPPRGERALPLQWRRSRVRSPGILQSPWRYGPGAVLPQQDDSCCSCCAARRVAFSCTRRRSGRRLGTATARVPGESSRRMPGTPLTNNCDDVMGNGPTGARSMRRSMRRSMKPSKQGTWIFVSYIFFLTSNHFL